MICNCLVRLALLLRRCGTAYKSIDRYGRDAHRRWNGQPESLRRTAIYHQLELRRLRDRHESGLATIDHPVNDGDHILHIGFVLQPISKKGPSTRIERADVGGAYPVAIGCIQHGLEFCIVWGPSQDDHYAHTIARCGGKNRLQLLRIS